MSKKSFFKSHLSKVKLRTYVALGLLFILLPVILISLFRPQNSTATWMDDSWTYRIKVPVTAHTAVETNKYFTKTVDTSDTTKFQSDCGDIRFTDANGKVLQYYIASGCSSASTVVHVLVPSFPAGASDYYMYYGNVTAANGFSLSDFTAGSAVTVGSVGGEEKGTGPISYWSMDSGTGTTAYDSQNVNNGTFGASTAAPTWQTEDMCVSGKCIYFDGSNDYIEKTSAKNLPLGATPRTVEAWVRYNGSIAYQYILAYGTQSNGNWFGLAIESTGKIYIDTWSNDTPGTATTINDNKWHHVAATYNGSTSVSFYVDGNFVETDSISAPANTTGTTLRIGSSTSNDYFLKGYIDEPKIYNYAKTAAQIKAAYNSKGSNEGATSTVGNANQKFLSDGLVGYWKMDESSWTNNCSATSVTDSSGNGNNAKACPASTGPTGAAVGKFGNAGSFDGSDDYVEVPNTTNIHPGDTFTLAAWVKRSSTGTFDAIFGTATNDFQLAFVNDNIKLSKQSSSDVFVSTSTYTDTTSWHQIVAVKNGSQFAKVYYDGVEIAGTFTNQTISAGSSSVYIGGDSVSNDVFAGSIDEARIYNRALSAQEVRKLYIWAPGPVGYWNLDEKTGTTASDTSSNNNTGTLTNGPTWSSGKFGSSVSFDGVDDVVDAGSGSTLDDMPAMTLEAWIYTRSLGGGGLGRIMEKQSSVTDNGFRFQLNTSNAIIFSQDYSTTDISHATATNVFALNTWQHVTATWDGSATAQNIHIYVNGVEVSSYITTTNGSGSRVTDAAQNLRIGNTNNGSRGFDGMIDDARIYNYVRTQSQVIEDMNAGHPTAGGFVGSYTSYWNMDESNGTTAHDSNSTLANDITLSTSSWNLSGKTNSAWNGVGTNWLSRADDDDFDFTASDNLSISLWFKSDSASNPGTTEYLLDKSLSGAVQAAGYAIYAKTSGLVCFGIDDDTTWSPGDEACSTSDIYDATWHHIVVTKTGTSEIRIYVDGLSSGSDISLATTGTLTNSKILYLGDRDGVDNSDEFNGDIDEVKIYRSVLTQDQVLLDMNAGSSQNFGVTALTEASQFLDGAGNSPVGYWNLDEKTGTSANDKSGNENTGTLNNTPTWGSSQMCKTGSCLSFVSSSSQDVTVSTTISGVKTVSFWVYPTSTTSSILQLQATGAVAITASSGTISFTGFTSPTKYINGVQCTSCTLTANTWQYITVTTGTSISASQIKFGHSNSTYFDGRIDDIKFYDYARTQSQVSYDYNRGLPTGWWQFDECQGSTAYDNSGNGNNATLTYGGGTYTQTGTCNSGTSSDAWFGGVSGKFNSSLAMDTTTDTISVGDISMYAFDRSNAFSLSAWEKTTTNGAATLISKQDSSAPFTGWNMQTGSNGFVYLQLVNTYSTNALEVHSTNDVNYYDGNWHLITMTYDGSSTDAGVKIYMDGNAVPTTASFTSTLASAITNSISVYIGSRNAVGQKFGGQLDDVRIYNYVLSATQAKQIYSGNGGAVFYGPPTGQP